MSAPGGALGRWLAHPLTRGLDLSNARAARDEGMLVGISSGATLQAIAELQSQGYLYLRP